MTENSVNPFVIAAATDLTDTGDQAVLHAIALAQRLQPSALHLVTVLETDDAPPSAEDLEALNHRLSRAQQQLQQRAEQLNHALVGLGAFEQQYRCHLRFGAPVQAIHQVAVDVDADLIVVGTAARHGLARVVLGSVAEGLARMAKVPVLIAKTKHLDALDKTAQPDAAKAYRPEDHGPSLSVDVDLSWRPSQHISGLL